MSATPNQKMTVDEFLQWAPAQAGRYELYAGRVYAMAPERAGHAKVKFAVQTELQRALRAAGATCQMLPDGMTVRIDADTAHEPDALVYCGREVSDDTVEIADPVIVVEVLSPSTRHIDAAAKLTGYFQVASVEHYLIIDPDRQRTIHHRKQADGTILTRLVATGQLSLDPPCIVLDIARFNA